MNVETVILSFFGAVMQVQESQIFEWN